MSNTELKLKVFDEVAKNPFEMIAITKAECKQYCS